MDYKIADAELEIMRILWREKRPLKVAEFKDELEQNKGWNKSTTHTLVARLRDKGLIEPTERYGVARYIPTITENEFILTEEKAVLEKFGSAKALALAMVHNGHLTSADIEELREYFKMGGDGKWLVMIRSKLSSPCLSPEVLSR